MMDINDKDSADRALLARLNALKKSTIDLNAKRSERFVS